MSLLSDTRTVLAEALRSHGVLPEWRVHDMPPENIASPCIWVDVPAVSRQDLGGRGARVLVGTWAVVLLVDGADKAQVQMLDDAAAQAWDALDQLPRTDVTGMSPQAFDIGGPRSRGIVLTVEVTLMARTLCPPPLLGESPPRPPVPPPPAVNLLRSEQATIESGAQLTNIYASGWLRGVGAVERSTAHAREGEWSLALSAPSGSPYVAPGMPPALLERFTVTPGETVTLLASVWVDPANVHATPFQLGLLWYSDEGTPLVPAQTSAYFPCERSAWSDHRLVAVVPSPAVSVQPRMTVVGSVANVNTYLDRIGLFPGDVTPADWTAPAVPRLPSPSPEPVPVP